DVNGGNETVDSQRIAKDQTATKPTVTLTKTEDEDFVYTFENKWYTTADCTEEFDFSTPITKATKVYAGWTKTAKYTVTFDIDGVTDTIDSQRIVSGQNATEPETVPTKEADAQYTYTFAYWYAEGTTTAFDFANTPITGDTTLYAKWNTELNKYTVTFDTNGGSEVAAIENVEYGSKVTAPTLDPGKETDAQFTYSFAGWYKDADCTEEFDFANDTITGATTIYAKWDKVVNKYTVTFVPGDLAMDIDPLEDTEYGTKLDANEYIPESFEEYDGKVTVFGGWYTDAAYKKEFNFDNPIVEDTTLYAKWIFVDETYKTQGYSFIASITDLNAFRESSGEAGKYMLVDDIDLEGVTLKSTNNIFTGTFDGNGHVIRNASYIENAANKTGILVRELNGTGVIKNVKFVNCTAQVNNETVGLVSGMVNAANSDVQFIGLEFNACSVSANNYAGMLTGRINSNGTTLTADQITTKNGCRSSLQSYGGFIIGDIAGGADADHRNVVTFTNMDISGEIKGGNLNGSFIFGRIRSNTNCTLENSVIRSVKLSNGDMGILAGGGTTNGKNCTVSYKNVAILSSAGNAQYLESLGDLLSEQYVEYDFQNIYLPTDTNITIGAHITKKDSAGNVTLDQDAPIQAPLHNDIKNISVAVTPAWLEETLGLDFDTIWTVESEDNTKYRLSNSSTNVKSADATLVSISATTANAQTRFTEGSEFTSEGLVIAATYSDDVQLILDPSEYTVISTEFNNEVAGTYTITVKANEKNADGEDVTTTYDVILAEQTGFKVDTQFAKLVYTEGEDLDLSNLLVYSLWTDDVETKEVNSKDKFDKYTVDSTAFNKNAAGSYAILIAMPGFEAQTITVSVIDTKPVAVDNNIYINVDASAVLEYEGEKVDGVETFTTVTNAINYLASAKLGDVNKVIYVADGFYHEKITVPASLKNLKIIGESVEGTIIDYDAVEGTIDPIGGSVYKMDCATLHVNAEGFGLENITVQNSFNYIEDSSKYGDPQGFALTINADGAVINNVHLYGNQDTLYFKNGRVYLVDSLIEGNVDFIFGEAKGLAFFENCLINAVYRGDTNNTGYVTAMKGDSGEGKVDYGYIFNECAFTADGDYTADTLPTEGPAAEWYALTHNFGSKYDVNDGSMSLGRPWGSGATVSMINCDFTAAYSKVAFDDKAKSRWFSMSGNSPVNADYSEYGSTGDGSITEAVNGGRILTETEAANYTAANLFATTNGGVKWDTEFDYAGALAKLEAMLNKVDPTAIVVLEGADVIGDSYSVPFDDSAALTIIPKEWNANTKEYEVTFGDDSIAKFEDGKVYGLALGSTTMTITIGNVSRTIDLAVETAQTYTVSFVVPTGVTAPEAQTVSRNKKATLPTAPTLTGSVFKGWYKDADYEEEFDFSTEKITADTTLYGKFVAWADMYKENIVIYFDGTEGDGVDIFTYDNTSSAAGTYYGLTTDGKFAYRSANGDTQFNGKDAPVTVSFAVEKYATITLHQKEAFNMECYFNGVLVTPTVIQPTSGKVVTYVYTTDVAGTFSFKNTSGGNKYLTSYLSVTYPEYIKENTSVDFGDKSNLAETFIDTTNLAVRHNGDNDQLTGSMVFYVNPGATISISSYSGYTNYTIMVDGVTSDPQTGTSYSVTSKNGGKVVITSTNNNNYFYSMDITYPAVLEESTTITFGTGGNYKDGIDGVIISGSPREHDSTSCQFSNQTIKINLKAAATITFVGNWAMDFSIGDTVVQTAEAGGTAELNGYVYNAEAGELTITIGDTSKCYIKSIKIEY
ncbi:MAG: InlB B-repeat-containing protein, partial [Acholeplasmatales bacterium]|nr:InlB B-repeat-containing protein [Acholeplasmatales bacterium]